MYNDYQRKYEETLPQLLPLNKTNKNNSLQLNLLGFLTKQQQNGLKKQNVTNPKVNPTIATTDSYIIKKQQSQRLINRLNEQKIKQHKAQNIKRNQISRNLIQEMQNKIQKRAITEQNYPVSNETIDILLMEIDQQIQFLKSQVEKFINSLSLHPNNQFIKKEKQTVEKALNQNFTIRNLYLQKIQQINKISDLQTKISHLKNQNRQLKSKIARGIQKIQSHIHVLPSEKEKELKEQVNKYKCQLNREKQMRQNLQQNISQIVLNFKTFYDQADIARRIVASQLVAVKNKQIELNSKLQKLKRQKQLQDSNINFVLQGNVNNNLNKKPAMNRDNSENNLDRNNVVVRNRKETTKSNRQQKEQTKKQKNPNLSVSSISKNSVNQNVNFSLLQQIQKMRANQTNFIRRKKQ